MSSRPTAGALWGSAADAIAILDNEFTGSGYGGVNLSMGRGTPGAVLVQGNQFRNGGYAALVSAPSVSFQGNSVVGHLVGFQVSAAGRAVFTGNTIDASARTTRIVAGELVMQENHLSGSQIGILARAQRVTITSNRVENFRKYGMQLTDTAEGDISGNEVTGGEAGILIRGASLPFGALQIAQNVVRTGRGTGIAIGPYRNPAGRIDVVCSGNQVSGNASTGISIHTQGDIAASDNIITNVGGFGLLLSGARDASVTRALRNMIAGVGGGIAVEGARAVELDGNDVRNSQSHGYFVSQSDSVVVAHNHAGETTRTGISVGADALLRGDCNYDGRVAPEEVERAIGMVFEDVSPAECAAIESDLNGVVTVADVLEVVLNEIQGDAAPKPPSAVDIHDNNVMDSGDVGVLAVAVERAAAEGNVVRNSGSAGVSVTGQRFADVAVRMNTIEASGGDAILSAGARAVEISDNSTHGSGESGVRVRDAEGVVVMRNEVAQTGETALLVTGGGALSVTDNYVEGSSSGGIAAEGLRARNLFAVVERNGVTDVAGAGILLDSAGLAAAADNQVRNTGLDGIAVRRSDVVRLHGNSTDGSGTSALTIGTPLEPAGADVVIEGNRCKGSEQTAVTLSLDGRLVLHSNVIQGSRGQGVSVVEANPTAVVAAVGNRIGQTSRGGLAVANAGRAFVFDNVVFSIDLGSGITLSDGGHIEVNNNLVYAVGDDGIGLERINDARVYNNTLYVNGRYGVALNVATADVLDNILDQNGAAGLAVLGDAAGVAARYNLNTGAYDGIEPPPTDLASDPLFVDPDGGDDLLGGDGAADDDFHLRSGDDGGPASPAIDAGLTTPEVLGISGSTAADGRRDTGRADLGYHYGASPRFP